MAKRRLPLLLLAAYLAVGLLALLPRTYQAPLAMTGDEALWMRRSVRFARALEHGHPDDTYQSGHPGVTTMWLVTLAAGEHALADLDDRDFTLVDPGPARAWARARLAMAAVSALLVVLVAALAGHLVGHAVGLLAGVLLAGEPWLVGLGRVVHLDGLTAGLVAVTLLAALIAWERRGGIPFLLLAGAAAGLALLTRVGGLAVFPVLAVLGLRQVLRARGVARVQVVVDLGLVGATCVLVAVLGWPALRDDPLGTTVQVLAFAQSEAGRPHALGNFYLGREVAVPGPTFYPLVLALRLGPLIPLGLLAWAALCRLERRRIWRPGAVGVLAICALLLILAITPAAKKLDRYVLTAVPLLGIVAAAGLAGLGRRLGGSRGLAATLACAGLVQLGLCASVAPYYFAFYNPLLGGLPVARNLVLVGWGEEMRPVAAYLNAQPGADTLRIAAPAAIFSPLKAQVAGEVTGEQHLDAADYLVVYVNTVQRGQTPPPESTEVLTVRVNGVEMAGLYHLDAAALGPRYRPPSDTSNDNGD